MNLLGWFSIGLLWLAIVANVWSIRRNQRCIKELDEITRAWQRMKIGEIASLEARIDGTTEGIILHSQQPVKEIEAVIPWLISVRRN